MAVEDKYINANVAAGKLADPAYNSGSEVYTMVATFEVAAADSDGSKYRVFQDIHPDFIPVDIKILNDAITGGTDYDLGLYEGGVGGDVVDKDVFADGLDLSSGHGRGSEVNGLSAVAIDAVKKRIYELAGHTIRTKKLGYDIVFTANTVGTAAGTITVVATFIQG